ncbi:arylesterase [Ferrimonas pelagia]|uniref:Arylesterase n=1 Tax=Ferrimonas pelagia TaxID=1177826 RepID=A0ABP9FEX3_9GAMM
MRQSLLIVVFVLSAGFNLVWAQSVSILILGDSLSASYGMDEKEGWVTLMQQKHPDLTLINASISGETTAGGRNRLAKLLHQHTPDWIFIELGGNDGLRGFPPMHTQQNLESIIDQSLAAGSRVMLSEIALPPNYGRRYTQAFAQIFTTLTEQYELTLVPFFMEPIAVQPELMQADGIHPNQRAQGEIVEFLEPWFRQLAE